MIVTIPGIERAFTPLKGVRREINHTFAEWTEKEKNKKLST